MNTFEVAQLFRRYCDEPDQSFLSDADVATYLKLGYAEFLNMVNELAPEARIRGTTINLAVGAITYDLTQAGTTQAAAGTPSVLGPNPNETDPANPGVNWRPLGRMTRLQHVYELNANGTTIREIQIVSDYSKLTVPPNKCVWSGNTLGFHMSIANPLRLLYNYEQEIGLPGFAAGAVAPDQTDQTWAGFITAFPIFNINDDFQAWHDMIPLFAYAQYAIMDAAANAQITDRLAVRKAEFMSYMQQRSAGAIAYVNPTVDPSDWGWGRTY
jgi:hypothetical protein